MSERNKKYLWLHGTAGLGNRLYSICNAIAYGKKTERTLVVDWTDGQFGLKGENAFPVFFELKNTAHSWDIDAAKKGTPEDHYPSGFAGFQYYFLWDGYNFENSTVVSWRRKLIPKGKKSRAFGFWFPKDVTFSAAEAIASEKCLELGEHLPPKAKQKTVHYASFSPPFEEETLRNNIGLTPEIQAKIDLFVAQNKLDEMALGLHVRMTDKQPEKGLEILSDKLKLHNSKDQPLFLATDNQAVKKHLEGLGYNLLEYPKTQIDLPEGMGLHQWALRTGNNQMALTLLEESIIDMWLLSRCKTLLYQGNSSFSQVSRILKENKNCHDWQS